MRTALRISWLVTASLILTRLLIYPIDGIMWHLLGENFWLPRYLKGPWNAATLLSLSVAMVLTAAYLIERRRLAAGKVATRN